MALLRLRTCWPSTRMSSRALSSITTAAPPSSVPNSTNQKPRTRSRKKNIFHFGPINFFGKVSTFEEPPVFTHPVDHPKVMVDSMERDLVKELGQLHAADNMVTEAVVLRLYNKAIAKYESPYLHRRMIVNILTGFLTRYDLDWIRDGVIPLVPAVTDQLGECSNMILSLCIAAYVHKLDESPVCPLTQKQDDYICSTYNRLISLPDKGFGDFPGLNKSMLKVISISSAWKKLLTNTGTSWCSPVALHNLLTQAISAGDFDLVLSMLRRCAEYLAGNVFFKSLTSSEYVESVSYIIRSLPPAYLSQFVKLAVDVEMELSAAGAALLLDKWNTSLMASNSDKTAAIAYLNESSKCNACHGALDEESLTDEDVQTLKAEFYDKSIINEGEYHIADPTSLSSFVHWANYKEPYDLVIDGMNAFHCHFKRHSVVGTDIRKQMVNQVQNLSGRDGKRILIIIRRGALFYIPKEIQQMPNVDIYYLKDDTQDDVFTVYAALNSGTQCYILSSDCFREHTKQLMSQQNQSYYKLFLRWQRLRQIINSKDILYIMQYDKYQLSQVKYQFCYPLQNSAASQRNETCWHLPIHNPMFDSRMCRFPKTQRWLCLPFLTTGG